MSWSRAPVVCRSPRTSNTIGLMTLLRTCSHASSANSALWWCANVDTFGYRYRKPWFLYPLTATGDCIRVLLLNTGNSSVPEYSVSVWMDVLVIPVSVMYLSPRISPESRNSPEFEWYIWHRCLVFCVCHRRLVSCVCQVEANRHSSVCVCACSNRFLIKKLNIHY